LIAFLFAFFCKDNHAKERQIAAAVYYLNNNLHFDTLEAPTTEEAAFCLKKNHDFVYYKYKVCDTNVFF